MGRTLVSKGSPAISRQGVSQTALREEWRIASMPTVLRRACLAASTNYCRIAGSTADHLLALAAKCEALVKICSPRAYTVDAKYFAKEACGRPLESASSFCG